MTVRAMARVFVLGLAAGGLPAPVLAQQVLPVATPEALTRALESVAPGTVLALAGGDYGALALRGPLGEDARPVVIRSADPADPARFATMDLRDVAHLTLEGVVFDYVFQSADKANYRPFQIFGGTGITIRDSLFDGDVARGVDPADDGFPTGFGLGIRGTTGIVLEDNEIRDFYRGVVTADSRDVTLRGNDVHGLRMDGLTFAQVQNVLIEANTIHDFKRAVDSPDHADMIQFWTNRTTEPSSGIVIRGNVLNSGLGAYTQSIFMRNDQVDRGLAGPEMFYRNVTITDNVIINAHLHGITLGETAGLTIRNNSVLRNAASQGRKENPQLWTPQIRVAPASTGVSITRNVTSKITGYGTQADWEVRDNFLVQDTRPGLPGFYDRVFIAARTGDPRQLVSFGALPGGPLDGTGIGAPQLADPGAGAVPATVATPVIRILPDPAHDNRFRFEADASILPAGMAADQVAAGWQIDGVTIEGMGIAHTFSETGPHQVVLTLTLPDGTSASTTAEVNVPGPDVLVFSSGSGRFTSFAGRDPVIVPDLAPGHGPAILGQGMAPIVIRPEMIAPFFEARDFELRLRVRGAGNAGAAGELLRIHQTLVVTVTQRGNLLVQFDTANAKQVKLEVGPVDLFSDTWQDIAFAYSTATGRFTVEVNGRILGEARTSGRLPPQSHWGLSLGNPFGNRKSFDGEMEALGLRVNQAASAQAE